MDLFLEILLSAASLAFVFIAIGFCIFSHELGHFLAAKWRGLHIDAFSLGFKPFWRKKIGDVEYRLGWLPFGGYVELPQVDATDAVPKAADGTELPRAKAIDRIITAVAGPLFNILSGLLIACFIWWVGMPQDSPKMREITVLAIDETGPEFAAGLRPGDKIIKLNGEPFFSTWAEFVKRILFSIGEVELDVVRNGQSQKIRYIPVDNPNAPGSLKAEGIAWPFFAPLIPIEMHPESGSPAEKAGVKPGDVLIAVDGTPITDYAEFQNEIDQAGTRPVELTIRRGGETLKLTAAPIPIQGLGEEFNRYRAGVVFTMHRDKPGIFVSNLLAHSPAEKAGLKPGDKILAFDGKKTASMYELVNMIRESRGVPFKLELERDGKTETVELAAAKITPHTIGVEISMLDHPTPFQQFADTIDMSWRSLAGIVVGIGNKLGLTEQTSSLKPSHMSGPLGMGMVLFNSVRHSSLVSGIYFMVIISFALAIFNLFPLPVLDGGHIMFGFLEIIIRRPLPTLLIKGLSMVFVTLLIGLMLYVTFSDGRRLLRSFIPEETASQPAAEEQHDPATK